MKMLAYLWSMRIAKAVEAVTVSDVLKTIGLQSPPIGEAAEQLQQYA